MKLLKILISFLPLLFISISVLAQDDENQETKASLNNGTIESQFEYLYKKSPKWTDPRTGQQYRTIKINNLFLFRNNVYDSLKQASQKFAISQSTIDIQKNRIDSLKVQLGTTSDSLTAVTKEKDSINLFGMQLSKTGYNSILWTIIAALTALLAFFISKFKNSNAITIEANKNKAEIEKEYDEHKQRTLEREQLLRRELQDELNKQKYAKQEAAKKRTK
ncbi:MAG: tRNA (guanine-N1)-methyltransferase [Aureibaculum sp.]|nr:tRNA (guanine-N1)-methyltransferase [Aureibaculum sp.]